MRDVSSRTTRLEIGRIAGIEAESQDLFEEARAVVCAGSRATCRSTSRARSERRSSPRHPMMGRSRSRCASCWRTRSWRLPPRSRPCHRRARAGRAGPACRAAGGARWFRRPGLLSHLVVAGERLPGVGSRSAGRPGGAPYRRGGRTRSPVGTHGFLCEVLRLRGDLVGALAHGRRAVSAQ